MTFLPAKSVRRLVRCGGSLLLAVVTAGALASSMAWRWQRSRDACEGIRAHGEAAFRNGDYARAAEHLLAYLRQRDDPEVWLLFAQASGRVGTADRLLASAIYLRRYLSLYPAHATAGHELLDVYGRLNYLTEALDLAERLLAEFPGDRVVLRARAHALSRLHRPEDALVAADACCSIEPLDVEAQLMAMQLLREVQRGAELLPRAASLVIARPADARSWLILSVACTLTDEPFESQRRELAGVPGLPEAVLATGKRVRGDIAAHAARQALSLGLIEASSMRLMIGQLEVLMRRFDRWEFAADSLALLERAAEAEPEQWVGRMLMERFWQNRRYADLLHHADRLPLDTAMATDVRLLGLKAASLAMLDRREAAEGVADLLSASNSAFGIGWAAAIHWLIARESTSIPEITGAIQRALDAEDDAFLRWFLGNIWIELGESSLAREAMERVVATCPLWVEPRVQLSQLLLQRGLKRLAMTHAEAAVTLVSTPATLENAVLVLAGVSEGDHGQILNWLDQGHSVRSGSTTALRIALLADAGRRGEARRALGSLLCSPVPLSQSVVLQLAAVSRDRCLDLEERCFRLAEETGGRTPALLLARAMDCHRAGRTQEGRRLLEEAAQAASPVLKLDWQLVLCQYLDEVADGAASGAWDLLAESEAAARSLSVQKAALATPSTHSNRPLRLRCIERLRRLTGDSAVEWRFERARLLVEAEDDVSTAEAGGLLSEIIAAIPSDSRPRLLLARALARRDLSAAIEQARLAASLTEDSSDARLLLGALMCAAGDLAAAERQYRMVVDTWPDQPIALNNLAMLVFRRGGNLHEARGFARRALIARPEDAAFRDTLEQLQRSRPPGASTASPVSQ